MLQSFHQNAEQFEIMFNKTKYDALPRRSCTRSSPTPSTPRRRTSSWKAIDRYSKDYVEMQTKDKVALLQDARFRSCRSSSRSTTRSSPRSQAENPLFKEIVDSQSAFAERAVKWDMDNNVNRRMAYNHYFGQKSSTAPAKKA